MDNKKVRFNAVRDTEISTFFSLIKEHWERDITVLDSNNEEITIPVFNLYYFIKDTLIAHKSNVLTRIIGVDSAKGFEMRLNIPKGPALEKICLDIWNNPHKYYKLEKDEDTYSEFLKYLWIQGPGYKEEDIRLADYIDDEI